MNRTKLFEEIKMLPTEQRMLIAEYILESLNPTNSNIEAAWKKEVDRRMKAVDKGQSRIIPSEEFHNGWYSIIKDNQ